MPSYYRLEKWDKPACYAVKHRDFQTRMESRSGGIFTALSDCVLDAGGAVYGVVLEDNHHAIHTRAESKADRNLMRGSKYIQSEMRDVFPAVKTDLEAGKKVLFSGTSCQTAGLKAFLGRDYEELLLVDIVCHGVPSPLVWEDYLQWQEQKQGSKVRGADFRNKKKFGWKAHKESLFFENGEQTDSQVYSSLFYSHLFLRPSCYQCPYKDIIHPGNITIADYWGIDQAAPGFNDDKGVSLVLINDEKGKLAFDAVRDMLEVRETRLEESMQPPLKGPYPEPENRTKVWTEYYRRPFEVFARKYGGYGLSAKIRRKIRWILKGK